MQTVLSKVLCILIVCIVGSTANDDFKLPPNIDVCYRDDIHVDKCIKKTIEKIVPTLKGGSKELELEPFDPLDFKNLTFSYSSPIIGGNMHVPLIVLKGLSKIRILNVRIKEASSKKFVMDFDALVPWIGVRADFGLKGNVLLNDVDFDGHIDMDYENITIAYHFEGNVQTINKREYLDLKKFYWRFTGENIQKLDVLNEDVVKGRPLISRLVTTAVRTTWRPLLNKMAPAFLPRTDEALKNMFTKMFKKYPYDVLFPKRKLQR